MATSLSRLYLLLPLRYSCRALGCFKNLEYCTASTGPQTSDSETIQDHEQEVALSPTGWTPPTGKPAPHGVQPDVPFRVRRSVYHQLPVYTEYRNGRSRVLTRISKIDGDIVKMEQMLRRYLPVDNLRSRVDEVTGSIVLAGDHRVAVRKFLKELGF